MSEAVSILKGASFSGAVEVSDAGLRGMITLRGDLADAAVAGAVKSLTGLAMPELGQIRSGAKGSVAWMSPDEVLILLDYDKADDAVTKIDKALQGKHFMAVNVSDARALFSLKGAGVREVIAKGAPADLSPAGLPVGTLRRSRLGQVAAAFWLSDETTMHVICFRSVGGYVYDWLCTAAAPDSLPNVL